MKKAKLVRVPVGDKAPFDLISEIASQPLSDHEVQAHSFDDLSSPQVFTVMLYLVLSFMPVPCFENLFSDLFFYAVALVSTFFMYTFFPEVLLHDFMFMHYLALFTIPLIPLAFAYMPMFAARSYLFL